jgi:hypothetical protein
MGLLFGIAFDAISLRAPNAMPGWYFIAWIVIFMYLLGSLVAPKEKKVTKNAGNKNA